MNRVEIKTKAKEVIKGNLWTFWKGYLLLSLLLYIIEFAFGFVVGAFGLGEMGTSIASIISSLIVAPLSLGFIYYTIKYARQEAVELNDIFRYKKAWFTAFLLTFLISLFTTLWTFLLIIPGIVAALSYSMAQFIYCDQELEPMECIKASKEMMKGYKWDYFVFGLSFFGWIVLGIFTLGLLYIWLIPYMMTAEVIYYEELKKLRK